MTYGLPASIVIHMDRATLWERVQQYWVVVRSYGRGFWCDASVWRDITASQTSERPYAVYAPGYDPNDLGG